MLDAYSLRKIAPRILIGVIGINLSIYLCVAAIDITNIVGGGIGSLLRAPFLDANSFTGVEGIQIQGNATNTAVGVVGLGAIGALITGIIVAPGLLAAGALAVLGLLMPLLVTALLLAIAVLVVVVIRYGLLVFLSVISPVAIACFILPGTEKYFRQWWDLFVKTLVVYPIIAVMFALSDILAAIFLQNAASDRNSDAIGLVTLFTAIIAILAPLFMIPFAFKFAGGIMATAMNAAGNFSNRAAGAINKSGFVEGRRQHYAQQAQDKWLRSKAQAYRNAQTAADNQRISKGRRWLAGRRAKYLAGYDKSILAKEAAMQAREIEATNKTTSSGDDTHIRALTANLAAADRARARGEGEGDLWRIENGQHEVRTAGGKWVSRQAAVEAHEQNAGNTAAYQAALSYEMRKATTQEEQDHLLTSFGQQANDWGLTEDQANGVWIGAAFANQNENRQWKYHSWGRDEQTGFSHKTNGLGLMTEIDEKQGSYASSMQNADTWTTMSEEVSRAQEIISGQRNATPKQLQQARETVQRAARISDSITTRTERRDENGEIMYNPDGSPMIVEHVGAGAPGRVAEEMRAFSKIASQAGEQSMSFNPKEYGTPQRTPSPGQAQDDRSRPTDRNG